MCDTPPAAADRSDDAGTDGGEPEYNGDETDSDGLEFGRLSMIRRRGGGVTTALGPDPIAFEHQPRNN